MKKLKTLVNHAGTVEATRLVLHRIEQGGLQPSDAMPYLDYLYRGRDTLEGVYYFQQNWQERPVNAGISDHPDGRHCHLVFGDSNVMEPDRDVVFVQWGNSFAGDGQCFTVNPRNFADYLQLADQLIDFDSVSIFYQAVNDNSEGSVTTGLQDLYDGIHPLFLICKLIMATSRKLPVRKFTYVYQTSETPPLFPEFISAVAAMLKTLAKEKTGLQVKCLGLGVDDDLQSVLAIESGDYQDTEVRYVQGNRLCRVCEHAVLDMTQNDPADTASDRPQKGVYLITGGMGGLGQLFAAHLLTGGAVTLLLVGRSVENEGIRAKLARLREQADHQSVIEYISADLSGQAAVKRLFVDIQQKFGALNGIIHAAGQLRDSLLLNKEPDDFQAVLKAKVDSAAWLDECSKDLTLDYFVCFSSFSSVVGNAGQSDYAFANGFLDTFMDWRQQQVAQGRRSGKSISINWPLWQDGGMQVNAQIERWIRENLGLDTLSTLTGLKVFDAILADQSDRTQYIPLTGNISKITEVLGASVIPVNLPVFVNKPVKVASEAGHEPVVKQSAAKQGDTFFHDDLVTQVSGLLKVDYSEIDPDEDIADYGFDSIGFSDLAQLLNQRYSIHITPALFFEQTSCVNISAYLMDNYPDAINRFSAQNGRPLIPVESDPDTGLTTDAVMRSDTDATLAGGRFLINNLSPAAVATPTDNTPEAIAIIGMSGVLPGSENLEQFWHNLEAGNDLISEVPASRWDWQDYLGDPQQEANKTYAKWGGFIEDADCFDAKFFDISPREAALMDPQQRVLLQNVWHCIENAGYNASALGGSDTGVFVGIGGDDYSGLLKQHIADYEAHMSTGVAHSMAANRISFLLDFHGPSEAIDTACSSSLVAIHRAVQSIRDGSCQYALAGATNIITSPVMTLSFSKAGMLSRTGRCKTFSSEADGYVRSEGCGVVLLKRLSQAEKDGDHIHAVILNSAQNHGGQANSLTAPNPNAQADLLVKAYSAAGINPASISYIEAHGTGTPLGDPIEINGLKKAFGQLHQQYGQTLPVEKRCAVGSVKSQVGHLETVAGFAGLFKTVLALQHQYLPGNLHLGTVNPHIEIDNTPFYFLKQGQPWQALSDQQGKVMPRRAGVSSFGFGGSNAHLVVQEYLPADSFSATLPSAPEGGYLIILSARTGEALDQQVVNLSEYLHKVTPSADVAAIAYTLQTGRDGMKERLALLVKDVNDLQEKLRAVSAGSLPVGSFRNTLTVKAQLRHTDESRAAMTHALHTLNWPQLAEQWLAGLDIDWSQAYSATNIRKIPLPVYPFAKVAHWFKSGQATRNNEVIASGLPVFQTVTDVDIPQTLRFGKLVLSKHVHPEDWVVAQHQVAGSPVFPAMGYLEMLTAALRSLYPRGVSFRDVVWLEPLYVNQPIDLTITLERNGTEHEDGVDWQVGAIVGGNPITYATGKAMAACDETVSAAEFDWAGLRLRCQPADDRESLYAHFERLGIHYGAMFRGITQLLGNTNEALSHIQMPVAVEYEREAFNYPVPVLDAALQSVMGVTATGQQLMLPFAVRSIHWFGTLSGVAKARIRSTAGSLCFDIDVCNEQGEVCVRMEGLCFRVLGDMKAFTPPVVKEQSAVFIPDDNETEQISATATMQNDAPDHQMAVLEEKLLDELADVLQIEGDQLDTESAFSDFGVDSILAVELVNRFNRLFAINLRATELFNYPSISELVQYILHDLKPDPEVLASFMPAPSVSMAQVVSTPVVAAGLTETDPLDEMLRQLQAGVLDIEIAEREFLRGCNVG